MRRFALALALLTVVAILVWQLMPGGVTQEAAQVVPPAPAGSTGSVPQGAAVSPPAAGQKADETSPQPLPVPAPMAQSEKDPKPRYIDPSTCSAPVSRLMKEAGLEWIAGCTDMKVMTASVEAAHYALVYYGQPFQCGADGCAYQRKAGLVFPTHVVLLPDAFPDFELVRKAIINTYGFAIPDNLGSYVSAAVALEKGGWQMTLKFNKHLNGTAVLRPETGPGSIAVNVRLVSSITEQDAQKLAWQQVSASCKPVPGSKIIGFYPDATILTGTIVWGTDADYFKTPYVIAEGGGVTLPKGCDPRVNNTPTALSPKEVEEMVWAQVKAKCQVPDTAILVGSDPRPQADGSWHGTVGWGSWEKYTKTHFFLTPQGEITLPAGCGPAPLEVILMHTFNHIQATCGAGPDTRVIGFYPDPGSGPKWTGLVVWGTEKDYVKTPFEYGPDGKITLPSGCDPRVKQ